MRNMKPIRYLRPMALIIPGQATASGRLNDVVLYTTRWGNVCRGNTKPTKPATPRQLAQRVRYTDINRLWLQLSRNEKVAWEQTYGMRNYQNFLKVNLNLVQVGQPPLRIPPNTVTIQFIKDFSPGTFTPSILGIHWQHNDGTITLAHNEYMVLSATQPRASHARCFDPWYRICVIYPPGTTSPIDFIHEYSTTWFPTTVTVGLRIFVQAIIVDSGSGFASPPYYCNQLITS